MRKNSSLKQNSFSRGRGSRGKEISIQLQGGNSSKVTKRQTNSKQLDHSTIQKMNESSWNPNNISQNILKDIMNYSNYSQTNIKSKIKTLAVYQKTQDAYQQLNNKINKKSNQIKIENRKLTLDPPLFQKNQLLTAEMLSSARSQSLILQRPELFQASISHQQSIQQSQNQQTRKINIHQIENSTIQLQQHQQIYDNFVSQYTDLIPVWTTLISARDNIMKLQNSIFCMQQQIKSHRESLSQNNQILLGVSKEFIKSRKNWDNRENGMRNRVIQDTFNIHEQFIKKLTVRDFQETVLFNIKVAIPDHKARNSLRQMYQQLFKTKNAKKFTMILKKHSTHMDLYDGKLLVDFTKKINDQENQFLKYQQEKSPHPDDFFLQKIQQIINNIDISKQQLNQMVVKKQKLQLKVRREKQLCKVQQNKIQKYIQEVNNQVKFEYQKQTQSQADFKNLLASQIQQKYFEFKKLIEKIINIQNKIKKLKFNQ